MLVVRECSDLGSFISNASNEFSHTFIHIEIGFSFFFLFFSLYIAFSALDFIIIIIIIYIYKYIYIHMMLFSMSVGECFRLLVAVFVVRWGALPFSSPLVALYFLFFFPFFYYDGCLRRRSLFTC
jgi:hypothetical protein